MTGSSPWPRFAGAFFLEGDDAHMAFNLPKRQVCAIGRTA